MGLRSDGTCTVCGIVTENEYVCNGCQRSGYEEIKKMATDLKPITSPEQVPQGHHWAIVVYVKTNVHHEGDERSRKCPGHGYPEYTETISSNEHYATTDKKLWEDMIRGLLRRQKDFIAFEVLGTASIKINTEINIRG